MPPAPYPDFRWLFRSLRALPIVAIAALVGGIIGGFSVFAVDLAVTAPPTHDVGSEVGKITAEKAGNSAATAPAAGTSAPPAPEHAIAQSDPASAAIAPQPNLKQPSQSMQPQDAPQTPAQTAPHVAVTPPLSARQATWPDALSHRHNPPAAAPSATAASTVPPAASPPTALQPPASQPPASQPVAPERASATPGQAPAVQAARAANSTSDQPNKSEIARKPIPAKRYMTVKRNAGRAANGDAEAATRVDSNSGEPAKSEFARKPIPPKRQLTVRRNTERTTNDAAEASTRYGRRTYDSYGRSDAAGAPDARTRYEYSNRRYYSRRERADDDDRSAAGYVEDSDRGDAMPPQPAAPPLFFGLFGFGDR